MGRKLKPYQASWGEVVPGLAHDTDGKWRISQGENTGKKWREADERKAVAKAKALLGLDTAASTTITATLGDILPDLTNLDDLTDAQAERYAAIVNKVNPEAFVYDDAEHDDLQTIPYKIPVAKGVMHTYRRRVGDDDIRLDPWHWKSDAVSTIHLPGQDAINEQVEDADIIVAMFWTRRGQPRQHDPA